MSPIKGFEFDGASVKLSELIHTDGDRLLDKDVDIRGIAYDSRLVTPGGLFVAIPGLKADGHDFIDEAVARGAAAVIGERSLTAVPENVVRAQVADSRAALARAASIYYGRPSTKLRLIGITGTNGKTTTAYLIESIFKHAGYKTGLLSTIEYRIDGASRPATRTTPESSDLQRLLADMVDEGVEVAVMEVSSHALRLKRVDGCVFAARVFTNLSQDHLDFHADLEDYFSAKSRLFVDSDFDAGFCLVNDADEHGQCLAELCGGKAKTFGREGATYWAAQIDSSVAGTAFRLDYPEGELRIRTSLTGDFNVANITAAAAVALESGLPSTAVVDGVMAVERIPGRFESVDCGQDFHVVVDYAHTPDGLEKVLAAAKALAGAHRLITVFGCGGDRDTGKRPKMGEIAARVSDIAVITSDNPRSETPQAIIDDILAGVTAERSARTTVVIERGPAIKVALAQAGAGDVVVIAGKGHEAYQILGDEVVPFDDRLVACRALEELLNGSN